MASKNGKSFFGGAKHRVSGLGSGARGAGDAPLVEWEETDEAS